MSKKYPLGKPLYTHMTEGRHAANAAMKKLPKVRAKRRVVLYPDSCECTARERKTCPQNCKPLPCVCDIPTGERTHCQERSTCPIPAIKKILNAPRPEVVQPHPGGDGSAGMWYVRYRGLDYARFNTKGEADAYAARTDWYDGPPGVKLMELHNPAALAGAFHNPRIIPGQKIQGSLMGPDEYATRGVDDFPDGGRPVPWQFQIAEYVVRESDKGNGQWGIYCRKFNVRLATFAPNSFALRDALERGFDAAHVLKKKRIADFKASRKPRKKKC